MKHTPKNLVYHELIGLHAEVYKSKNPFQEGLKGIIIDETKNTIVLKTDKGPKIIPKKDAIFRIKLPSKQIVEVDGKVLIGRPEDRLKKKYRDW